jgi:hypothetical protein
MAGFNDSVNNYNQIILQNTNSGNTASTNFNVSNNLGTSGTNFGEFGMNSSTFSGTGSFSTPGNVYLAAATTDLAIGTYSTGNIHFVTNSSAGDAMAISTSGITANYPVTLTTSGTTDPLIIDSNNGHGGTNFAGIATITNTSSGVTNGTKYIRINSNGGLEVVNSAYTSAMFSIADNGLVGIPQATVTSNLPTTNAINLNNNGYLYDDGNLHLHSSGGSVWINATDGSLVEINTQLNSGSGGLNVGGAITGSANTGNSYISQVSQSGIDTAFNTSLAMDNLNVRIYANGGNAGLIQASAVSGSFTAYVTTQEMVAGYSIASQTNSSGISFSAGTWTSINAIHTISSGGDVIVAYITDTTNKRAYRVTCIHGDGSTSGHITIERLA